MKKIFMKSNKNFIFQNPEFSDFIEGEIKISLWRHNTIKRRV